MRFKILIAMVGLALGLVPIARAQSGLGNITGHVTDPQGAFVSGAKVAANNLATGVQTNATTNGAGIYELLNLVPGTYSVGVTNSGFQKAERLGVLVQVEDNVRLDFALQVGSTNEVMTVTAEVPQLRTEDAQLGEVVTESMIETLPQLNRDPLQLLTLAGNVQGSGARAGWQMSLTPNTNFTFSGPADTRINGGRAAGVEYLVDGVPATGGLIHNLAVSTPTMDDVQEFKVLTNGISSEFGRLSGGAVEISTKSGTNRIHGQLFEYHQDAFLNANTWGNDNACAGGQKTGCSKSNFRQNDFGFAVGGPVVLPHLYNGKDKTFWFANSEWVRQSQSGNLQIYDTVTDQERNSLPDPFNNNTIKTPFPCPSNNSGIANPTGLCANLQDIGIAPNDPNFPYPTLGDIYFNGGPNHQFPLAGGDGRSIPLSEISPIALRFIALEPHPTNAPLYGGSGGNYLVRTPSVVKTLAWNVRVDHVITDSQRIYGRFAHFSGHDSTGAIYPGFASTGDKQNGAFSASLHYDYIISPTLVLDLNAGGNYSPMSHGSFLPAKSLAANDTGWGYSSQVTGLLGTQFPAFKNGFYTEGTDKGAGTQGSALVGNESVSFANTNFDYSASLTKILSRHTLKFGYDGRRYYDNFTNSAGNNPSGNGDGYTFSSGGVSFNNNDGSWSPVGNANGLGSFLYGLDSWSQISSATSRALAQNYYSSYLQDEFKVNRKLTLNLGIRWEMETPVTERHNNISVWDPNAPSPFTINPGYNWNAEVAAGIAAYNAANPTQPPLDPSQVVTPTWVTNGAFPKGAQVFVGTPQHPARTATKYHPWNFAPRLGFAYQVQTNTVLRGSFGVFFLPTGGNLTNYGDGPGIAYSTTGLNLTNPTDWYSSGNGLPQTMAMPFNDPASQLLVFTHNTQVANVQTAAAGGGTGGILTTSRMPHEYDWSFGVQRQLPHSWLLEATYAGNNSNTLQGPATPSVFPKNLYIPANSTLYTGPTITSPTAGQIPENGLTGSMQHLATLEFPYPYFGAVTEGDANVGSSHYESGNLRVQKRFSGGFQMLFNYTYSKALDDVGAGNATSTPSNGNQGSFGKSFQSVDRISAIYGLAAMDETHRISAFYDYQLPFGRGRRWMNGSHGVAGTLLQGVAGGWEISGQTLWHSGIPVAISAPNTNVDTGVGIYTTWATITPGDTAHNLITAGFHDPRAALCPSVGCTSTVHAFNASAVTPAASFTYGNLPPTIGFFRQPRDWTTNISVMKSFPVFSSDGSRYFQLRLEGQNIFNHPGLGNYDTTVNDSTYGQITMSGANGPPNLERHVQISGRFVF